MARYGQKGGDGPTAGKKAVTFSVVLPDGTKQRKRSFGTNADPVAYAYQHDGSWHVAGIAERGAPNMQSPSFTVCEVSIVPEGF